MGRKPKWNSETQAIRVPAHLSDRLLAQARAWDEAENPETLQGLSPVNPYRVEFLSCGELVKGKVSGVLVDWLDGGQVSAVLVDVEGREQQTQVPLENCEFLDLPDFVRKRQVGETLPLNLVSIEDSAGSRRYKVGGFYCPAQDLDMIDRLCDALIDDCEQRGIDPRLVLMRLCDTWLEPLEKSA